MHRRSFLSLLLASTALAAAPLSWAVRRYRPRTVNVRDFGAVGDGKTNDKAAFMAAMEAVKDGGTVYVPAGAYFVGRPFPVTANLRGDGRSNSIIRV